MNQGSPAAAPSWSVEEVGRRVRTATLRLRLLTPDPAATPASEARVLDALDELAVRYLTRCGDSPFMLATALLAIDAVAQLRATRGFVAAPSDDLAVLPRTIAARVYDGIEAAVVARPAPAWAHALGVAIAVHEARAARAPTPRQRRPTGLAGVPRPPLDPTRAATALLAAEAAAIVAVRTSVDAGADPGDAVATLAALAGWRRAVGVDREQLALAAHAGQAAA
ncbi:MAG: hypothetical protein R3B06_15705 [Kofleriaceae bacterium]